MFGGSGSPGFVVSETKSLAVRELELGLIVWSVLSVSIIGCSGCGGGGVGAAIVPAWWFVIVVVVVMVVVVGLGRRLCQRGGL